MLDLVLGSQHSSSLDLVACFLRIGCSVITGAEGSRKGEGRTLFEPMVGCALFGGLAGFESI